LIVDPPNGRLPALTPAAQKRVAERRARESGDSASYTDFNLTERCITRGLTGSVLPGGYNNGNAIVQSPGYVTIVNEMIHESRIVPLDGRPQPGAVDSQPSRRLTAATGTATRWWSRPRTSSIGRVWA
jgi:hypothetical protein